MPHPAADRNLLFGILALQMDFLGRDQLVAAMHAWVLDKDRPLGHVLCAQGVLSAERHALLDALVGEHLKQHGDPQRSLAAVAACGPVRDGLREVADADVQASLAHVGATPTGPTLDATGPYLPPAGLPPQARSQVLAPAARFQVLRPHARGGLGEVFVARDGELHREVALKEIQERHAHDPESRARFLLEAEVTGGLEHPGIVPVYGLGAYADGRPFYAMRLVKGDSLKDAVARFHREKEALPAGERALRLRALLGRFVAVCNAVAYAHSRGVLHRDLKPANVMLGPYGETLVVDWGLAKVLDRADAAAGEGPLRPSPGGDPAMTQAGAALGTPAYMSPEQAAGQTEQVGPRSDVYSLGATLYCLLTGRAPFAEGDVGEVLGRVQRGDFPPPRQAQRAVPAALEAVCLKAMALRPDDRYATPRELAEEVERWLADEPVRAHPEPPAARLGRWLRRHQVVAVAIGVLLLTGLVALALSTFLVGGALRKEEQARKERALAQVEALLNADPRAVPALLAGLAANRDDVLPRLRERWAAEGTTFGDRVRGRVGLALLPVEPDRVKDWLYLWMLRAGDPPEVLLVRDGLRPYGAELVPDLWRRAGDVTAAPEARFRALVALAAFDPEDGRWRQPGEAVLGQLLAANPLHLPVWAEGLRPVRGALRPPLVEVFHGSKLRELRQEAAALLADYAADQPALLADLALGADARQYAALLPALKARPGAVLPVLRAELAKAAPETAKEAEKDRLAFRQANAALTLLRLGEPGAVWSLLARDSGPSRRTYLTLHLRPYGVAVGALLDRLGDEPDVSARRALLLGLGEYAPDQVPAARRQDLVARLVREYRDDPDPGMHGAAEWLLRQWGEEGRLPKLRDHRPKDAPKGKPTWYVNKQGQTMVVLPGPVEFWMGSPADEAGHLESELRHRRRIGRSFAIASKEVTVAQFQEFLRAHPEVRHYYPKISSPDPDGPIIAVTWYEAAMYRRWLSEQEGVSEKQMCYPPLPDLVKCSGAGLPLRLPADYLARAGYRLPTEAEWEYACRAQADTSRSYGSSAGPLGHYAIYRDNAQGRAWPVGRKRPNDFGLFDMYGNAAEWCQDTALFYRPAPDGRPVEDVEDIRDVTDAQARVVRGSYFDTGARSVRSAHRDTALPSDRKAVVGLRVARTCD